MIKEYPDRSIYLKSRNVVKGYMKVTGVNYIESFFQLPLTHQHEFVLD